MFQQDELQLKGFVTKTILMAKNCTQKSNFASENDPADFFTAFILGRGDERGGGVNEDGG